MQPLFIIIIAIDDGNKPCFPLGARFNNLHPPGHSLHISNNKSTHTWFIDLNVVEVLVQPTQDILVSQPISNPQRVCFARDGTPSTPFWKREVQ